MLLHENQLALKTYLQVCGREDYEKVVRVASAVFLACRCSLSFLSDLVDAEIASTSKFVRKLLLFGSPPWCSASLDDLPRQHPHDGDADRVQQALRHGVPAARSRAPRLLAAEEPALLRGTMMMVMLQATVLLLSLSTDPDLTQINPMLLKPSESIETNLSHYVEFLERLLAVLYQSADFYPAYVLSWTSQYSYLSSALLHVSVSVPVLLSSTVTSTQSRCRSFLRGICRMLQEKVRAQFPEAASSAIAGFFFLRFVCPALIAPEGFGLLSPQGTNRHPCLSTIRLYSTASNESVLRYSLSAVAP